MAVAQNDIAHVTNAQPIHHDVSLGHLAVDPSPIRSKFQHGSAFDDKDVLCGDAHVFGHARVVHQVAVLAMDRHKETRADEVEHQFVFLAAAVT